MPEETDKFYSDNKHTEVRGPDPSTLTTQMTYREISSLKELLTSELNGVKRAIDVAHLDLVRVPTEVQKQVGSLKELLFEKIDHVCKLLNTHVGHLEKQFDTIERQRIEQKTDTRTAVDDALKAAKEAVAQSNLSNATAVLKSEAAFTKMIDAHATLLTTFDSAHNERINTLKEQLAKAEGRGGGMKDVGGWIVAAIAILFSLLNYLK